ncbi:MAG: hypothetical protein CSB33_01485 [Desulfobacterales bacterium]|nr:MAG: hypothetical protein CSB33_01485 [Desulfobacterales bacterium]
MDQDTEHGSGLTRFFRDLPTFLAITVVLLLVVMAWRIHKVDTEYRIDPKEYVKSSIHDSLKKLIEGAEADIQRKLDDLFLSLEDRLKASVKEQADELDQNLTDGLKDWLPPLESGLREKLEERLGKLEGRLEDLMTDQMKPIEKEIEKKLEDLEEGVEKQIGKIGERMVEAVEDGSTGHETASGAGCGKVMNRLKAMDTRLSVLERQQERILVLLGDSRQRFLPPASGPSASGTVLSDKIKRPRSTGKNRRRQAASPRSVPKTAQKTAPRPDPAPEKLTENALAEKRLCFTGGRTTHILDNQVLISLRDIAYPMRTADLDITLPHSGVHRFWYVQEGSRRPFEYKERTYFFELMKVERDCVTIALNKRRDVSTGKSGEQGTYDAGYDRYNPGPHHFQF